MGGATNGVEFGVARIPNPSEDARAARRSIGLELWEELTIRLSVKAGIDLSADDDDVSVLLCIGMCTSYYGVCFTDAYRRVSGQSLIEGLLEVAQGDPELPAAICE